jgi:hypothetical protein
MKRVHWLGISLFVLLQCCKDRGIIVTPDEKPDPRKYVWVRDTLGDGSEQSILFGVWGSSSSNVYVVGHYSQPFIGKIWHWNGLHGPI